MSYWDRELPNYRDTKRGVRPQPERIPAKKKHLDRDWLIVRLGCKKAWLTEITGDTEVIWENGRRLERRPKHWFDPPVMEKWSAHRTEQDALRELEKSRWMRERPHRYFICHRSVYERLRPYWKD